METAMALKNAVEILMGVFGDASRSSTYAELQALSQRLDDELATLEANFNENVADVVGAMFSSNTETGIVVTYKDGDNTIDLALDNEYLQDTIGAMFSGNTETPGLTVTYQDSDGTIDVEIDLTTVITNAGADAVLLSTGIQRDTVSVADDQAGTVMTIPAGSVGIMFAGHSTASSTSIFGVDTIGTCEISTKVIGIGAANGGLGSASAGSGIDGQHTWYLSSGGVVSVSNRINGTNTFWAIFFDGLF
jgi:hypothetical protein